VKKEKMETKMNGKAIISAMAAIMVASVFAAMVGSVGAHSVGGHYNVIVKDPFPQKVLIGQDLDFSEGWGPDVVTVSRVSGGVVEWSITADANNQLKVSKAETQWTKDGAFFVNFLNPTTYDAQLSVSEPIMPLELKVGTKKVASIAEGTSLTIYTAGMNLFAEDRVDLVIIGPNGQIKYDAMNNQQFTNISIVELTSYYGDNNLETAGWSIGNYTFQVKTRSATACGLDYESKEKTLEIKKGEISIDAEPTSTMELDTVAVIVTGVADDKIRVAADPCDGAMFKDGVDDTPINAGCRFMDTIDSDGIRKYAVEFYDTGTYTLTATVEGGLRDGSYDIVDITVLEKAVEFDMPNTAIIGERITVKGAATSGTYVSVWIDDTLFAPMRNLVFDPENGEFRKEVTTTAVGMSVPGIVGLKAWIDADQAAGDDAPTRSPDGVTNVLLLEPWLTASLATDSVDQGDDFIVSGYAPGSCAVWIVCVPPKGGGGKSLTEERKGITIDKASVSTTDNTFTKKLTVQKDATSGYYDLFVLTPGMDEVWDMTSNKDLIAAINTKYHLVDITDPGYAGTKTQDQVIAIFKDLTQSAGSDDLMQILTLKVGDIARETLILNPIADVVAGDPLVVTGETSRKDGSIIWLTVKKPYYEIVPQAAIATDNAFSATFDTTGAQPGTYTVKANDGYGYTTSTSVNIIAGAPP
jgi:hypothetical protein